MTENELKITQVIQTLDNGKLRVFTIDRDESHIGDIHDPLTTIVVNGYEDIEL